MVEMGKLATEKLLRRLREPETPPSHTVFAPQLIVRETSGGPAVAAFA
jgi:LacI family transcriptional regulator